MDSNENSIIVCLNCCFSAPDSNNDASYSASTCNNGENVSSSFDIFFDKLLALNCGNSQKEANGAGVDAVDTHRSSPTIDGDYASHFPWTLDTKYYTVALNLCKFFRPTLLATQNFADRIEAVVLHFDPRRGTSFSRVQSCFSSFISAYQPSLRVLYVDSPLSRDDDQGCGHGDFQPIVEWCVRNEFELVESEPSDDEARLEAEENRELFGLDRIMQILKAHNWPDLVMKDERAERDERAMRLKNYLSGGGTNDKTATAAKTVADTRETVVASSSETVAASSSEIANFSASEIADACNIPANAANSSNFLDADGITGCSAAAAADDPQTFEQLFAKFGAMKTTADQLTGQERKIFAAKVAMDFYKSLGGDDDDDVSDDDGENDHVIFSSDEEG